MSMIDARSTAGCAAMAPAAPLLDEYRPRGYAFIRRRGFSGDDAGGVPIAIE